MEDLSIYIHWPFCKSKCPYCDFMSLPEEDPKKYLEFSHYLFLDLGNSLKELNSSFFVRSIFFGGGTPSLMPSKSIEKIINFIVKNYKTNSDIEITLEANPGTFDKRKLKEIKRAGINRLSLGVQSFQDKNLQSLGRVYDSAQVLKSAEIVSKNFSNFSFDLIYGYKTQTLRDLEHDLSLAVNFECKHLSCYQLTLEEKTPFFELNKVKKILAGETQLIKFFRFMKSFLKKFSMERYEVSNYSLRNFESKHNLAYWKYKNYLGVGPSAHSRLLINKKKTELRKIYSPYKWSEKIRSGQSAYEEKNTLTEKEQLEEILIMGLRLTNGIDIEDLKRNIPPSLIHPILEKAKILSSQNLVRLTSQKMKLSAEGILKMNSVIEFLIS